MWTRVYSVTSSACESDQDQDQDQDQDKGPGSASGSEDGDSSDSKAASVPTPPPHPIPPPPPPPTPTPAPAPAPAMSLPAFLSMHPNMTPYAVMAGFNLAAQDHEQGQAQSLSIRRRSLCLPPRHVFGRMLLSGVDNVLASTMLELLEFEVGQSESMSGDGPRVAYAERNGSQGDNEA